MSNIFTVKYTLQKKNAITQSLFAVGGVLFVGIVLFSLFAFVGQANTAFADCSNDCFYPLQGTCYADPSQANVGDIVTWYAGGTGGNGSYSYSWNGTDGLSGSSFITSKAYSSVGLKQGNITITSGNQSVTIFCSNAVTVSQPLLNVSCSANPTNINVGQSSNWTASVSGGNGSYSYSWSGSVSGSSQVVSQSYATSGTKFGIVTVTSGNQAVVRSCSNIVDVQDPLQTLSGSCTASPSLAQTGDTVTWTANPSG